MKWLNHIPLLRLVIPFALGIIWAFYHPYNVDWTLLIILSLLPVLTFFILKVNILHQMFQNRWIFGALMFLFLFLLGYVLTNLRVEKFQPNHFSNFLTTKNLPEAYVGVISSEPEIRPNSVKAVVRIQQIKIQNEWVQTVGKCLVYFKKNDSIDIQYGDEITFLKSPSEIDPPANFDEFDYKRYLSHHYIYQRLYLADNDYKIIGFHPPSWLKQKAIVWRNFLLHRYKKFGMEGEQLAILSALTLGKKESLTPELKSAYSSAGAMHVLAVSGLHVGIIFLVLKFLLGWLEKYEMGKIIQAILLLFSVWFYAFITGLSPSVIRAATMFSFMIIALSFKRTSNIYNTLALSAFAILIYQPFMLLEVGFQLSYLAVIGIIYLHPYLYNLRTFKPWLLDKAWNITCVSLSAQLVTAPLGILYFHQFPTYFLFSNLIVIPAAFIIMGVAIAFQTLSFIPFVGTGIAFLLNGIVWLLNMSVHYLEKLPESLIGGLDITVLETWLLYFIIIGITAWLTQANRKFALITLAIILALTISQTFEKWTQLHQKQITFYQSGRDMTIELVNGYFTHFIADSSLIHNSDKMQFYIYHHWWKRGISTDVYTHELPQQKPISIGNSVILRIENDEICSCEQVNALQPDVIYFNSYRSIVLDSISNTEYKPLVIIGPRASSKMNSKITQFCNQRNWTCYDIKKSGAIKLVLDDNFGVDQILIARSNGSE